MSTATIEVQFPGGKRVDARVGDFLIRTDQSVKGGGEASAPEPFDLFLASLATCAGIFALGFCQSRDLPTGGLGLRMVCERDDARRMIRLVRFQLDLPQGFPEKYRAGIVRAMELCAVKRHMNEAPEFAFELSP
ncbi:MAG TPA: osmotically inducible protein OsmC [Sedimenticola thiotaurini]|uniref:Osmotically inducible protein OsmC n=1 Tax=Sedimenticola thiotaurini TaxID=1543721 RepID=A0A831WBQ1_9GAMM|nr:osmotically inducible protein OsmC [Sedimenticola thiotaurini]